VGLLKLFYADMNPTIIAAGDPAAVYTAALDAARAMPRWELLAEQPPGSSSSSSSSVASFQAVATTKTMRFKDDVVERLTHNQGSDAVVVDVRSRSGIGQARAAAVWLLIALQVAGSASQKNWQSCLLCFVYAAVVTLLQQCLQLRLCMVL
jgi:hypothetical protein